jgi:hypothetical protein
MADDKAKAKAIKDSKKKNDTAPPKDDRQAAKAPNPEELEQIDPRKFIIINPPAKDDIQLRNVTEHVNHHARSQTETDYFIRLGLGDQDHLNYYRQAIMDPARANMNPNLRKYVSEVAEQLLDIVWGDTQMKNRLRTILQDKYMRQTDVDNRQRGLPRKVESALFDKAHAHNIDPEIIFEVFERGLDDSNGNIEKAFNRVNSFLAGGRARKIDEDLGFNLIKKAMRAGK